MDSNVSPIHFLLPVIGSFLNFQEVPLVQQAYKEQDPLLYFYSMIVMVGVCSMQALSMSFVNFRLPLPHSKFLGAISRFAYPNIRIYIETAVGVVISYVSLLVVNWSYIWLAIFPAIAIGFIVALCKELSRHHGEPSAGSVSDSDKKPEYSLAKPEVPEAEAVGLVPFWALCLMGYFHADRFVVSRFLLFSSSMLGALTLMMTRLAATGACRGVAPASVLLRRTFLVVLLVAVHAVAAEQLGEKVALFCLPEVAPVLLWFSVRLDGGGGALVTGSHVKLLRSTVVVVLVGVAAAVLALLLGKPKAMVELVRCCGVSGLLCCCVVFTLGQWPGQDGKAGSSLQEAVKLLKIWAAVLLIATPTFLGFTYLAA